MAYETRGVRPFDTLDRTQTKLNHLLKVQSPPIPEGFLPPLGNQALEPLGVDARSGSIAGANGTVALDPDQYTTNALGLYFGVNDDDWRDFLDTIGDELTEIFGLGHTPAVSLLVTATNARLRQSVELLHESYSDFAQSDSWRRLIVEAGDTDDRPRPLRMPYDGCVITVQFILREDLANDLRQPGRPWRKGSWLARSTVKVVASKGSGLAPRPLTPTIRERFGIGDRCSVYIDLRTTSGLSTVNDLSDVVRVFIDETSLDRATELKPNGDFATPAGQAVVARWVMDTYRALVHALATDDQLPEFDLDADGSRQTFLYGLLQQVSDHGGISIEEAFNVLREQPNRFIALIENSVDVLSADTQLLELRK